MRPRIVAILAVLALLFGAGIVTASPAAAACSGTHCDAQGTLELSGSSWLGGAGVDIYANNGSASYDSGVINSVATPNNGTVTTGEEWQCVEMINRLYLSKGWIVSTWSGNGGQFYDTAPLALAKQANGSITDLKPGDVVVLQDSGYGHVGVINSVSGTSVIIVNQNTAAVYSSATFTNGTLSMSGWASYTVKGVVHAPSDTSTSAPTDPSQLGVSMAFNPTNGRPTVAVQGPSNSLYVYWQTSSGSWAGPLGIGGSGSTYSAPSIAFNPVTGLPTIAARGPGSRLWVYWQNANGSWSGPLGVGAAGSTYAMPSLAFSPSGNPTVAVQGPSNSLWVYWANGGSWTGPLGVGASGSVYDAPSVAFNSASGLPTIAVQGPSNTLRIYWQLGGGAWTGPLGVGGASTTYSAPSLAFNASGQATIAAQGPSNSLYAYWMSGSSWAGPLGVGASGSTFSAPSIAFNTDAAGLPAIAVEGPGNRLWLYWQQTTGAWAGPLGIAGSGSTFSAPALAFNPLSATPFIAAEATNHTLWGYWSNSGTWYGPLGIAGSGSAYH